MENFNFPNNIKVVCIQATSFPDGVMAAHEQLHKLVTYSKERKYFGISHPVEKGKIIYKAAVEVSEAEMEQLNDLEEFTIVQGEFASITIQNYMDNLSSIGEAFQQLIHLPNINPKGYCLEWYVSDKEVKCLVPLV